MENTTKILIALPNDLSIKLDRELINLKERGVKMTKQELCIKLIESGFGDFKRLIK